MQDSKTSNIEYFESPLPDGNGLCSDNNCPCSDTLLPPGSGYLYVSLATVGFRNDAKSVEEAYAKMERRNKQGTFVLFDKESVDAILMCEVGARLRNIDLEVAGNDAKYWWNTGLVPLRPTPIKNSKDINEKIQSIKPNKPLTENTDDELTKCYVADNNLDFANKCLLNLSEKFDNRSYKDFPICVELIANFRAKDFDKAFSQADEIIKNEPDWHFGYTWKANVLVEWDQLADAVKICEDGLSNVILSSTLCEKLGDIYFKTGDYKSAIVWFIRSCYIQIKNNYFSSPRPFLMLAYYKTQYSDLDENRFNKLKDYSSKCGYGEIEFSSEAQIEAVQLYEEEIEDWVDYTINKMLNISFLEKTNHLNGKWIKNSTIEDVSKQFDSAEFFNEAKSLFLLLPFYAKIAIFYRVILRLQDYQIKRKFGKLSRLIPKKRDKRDDILDLIKKSGNSKIELSKKHISKLSKMYSYKEEKSFISQCKKLLAEELSSGSFASIMEEHYILPVKELYSYNDIRVNMFACHIRDFLIIYFESRDKNWNDYTPVNMEIFGELWPNGFPIRHDTF